ncbi:unnamed protein product [Tuber melanosporum]|uniref:(Perigord truffle) hypothetical protein n=1 Tax=Tuber melanosporum (strain Mel28) TaxID=656061 RepID=D5G8G0_TUBMM|nr:uncharacterized protein GSTUM_00004810001 [Tuber melanosporum]CAZ80803.1 unnamed protein product [Tuber melanosporum]
MPSFFAFQQGSSDSRSLPPSETESLRFGRFRAIPLHLQQQRRSVSGLFTAPPEYSTLTRPLLSGAGGGYGSNGGGYGAINISRNGNAVRNVGDDNDEEEDEVDERWWLDRVLISPRKKTVVWMMEIWYRRLGVLVVLPAGITIVWCGIPFPKYPLSVPPAILVDVPPSSAQVHMESHGKNLLRILWTAVHNLLDISVIRNLISSSLHPLASRGRNDGEVNQQVSGPGHGEAVVCINFWFFLLWYYAFYNFVGLLWITKLFNLYSVNWWPSRLGFPPAFTLFNLLPLFLSLPIYYLFPPPLLNNNLTWILLTFTTMSGPVLISFLVLLSERRSALRTHTMRNPFHTTFSSLRWYRRQRWGLTRSFTRFIWFCSALILSLIAFVLGEAYAEVYLRTLPHTSLETVIYVWSWIATIHLLDATTGWILGTKVGSYPLGWVFKLYFATTYQTYVRALYARLRSPSQFAYLQLLSSSIVIVYHPLSMTPLFHKAYTRLGLTDQTYREYQKYLGRGFFVRGLAENVTMVAWLGWVLALHYGWNREVYPYFSFDEFNFKLTFYASVMTWACEVIAGWCVRGIVRRGFGFEVMGEGVKDLVGFDGLLPAVLAVQVHVLQNMLVSIARLRF